ncbi:MAG: FAD-dependent oxidoreductase, partial [Bacteroidota bacterium]
MKRCDSCFALTPERLLIQIGAPSRGTRLAPSRAMEQPRHHTRSYWETDTPAPLAHPPLAGDFECDVAVVGAGFTGLTAALLIKRAGLRVALLEAREDVALGESGRTTAHLTEVLDERYRRLITDFGREGARLASRAQRDAITWIERIVAVEGIECGFRRVPAFLYTEHERDVTKLREELTAMRKAGLAARLTREVPVRFPVRAGIRVEAQAELHPRDYLRGLAERIPG